MRLLIAEDEVDLAEALTVFFEKNHFSVDDVHNGFDAYGDLTLDPGSGNLSCGKDPIRLSGREFQIMELFMRSPRQVFSAERIMERVWGWDNEAEINVVWVNISNLRKKLKSIGSHVTLQANRGLGYVLEESV